MDRTEEEHEGRVLNLALKLEEFGGVRVMDTTATIWDLTHVRPAVRSLLEEAADLAGVEIEITKVGDEARAFVKEES